MNVRRGIALWRRTRTRRSPMPPELWNTAALLAREYGVCSIARALHLDYKALKARAGASRSPETTHAGFIELRPSMPPATSHERILELSDSSGMKIVLRQTGGADIDTLRLVEVFRNTAR